MGGTFGLFGKIKGAAHQRYGDRNVNAWWEQVAFQSNANHPLAESMDYIKFEGM